MNRRLSWFYTTAKQMTFFLYRWIPAQNIKCDSSLTRMHSHPTELCAKVQLWSEGLLHQKFDGTWYWLDTQRLGPPREIAREHEWPIRQSRTVSNCNIFLNSKKCTEIGNSHAHMFSQSGGNFTFLWVNRILKNYFHLLKLNQMTEHRRQTNIPVSWQDSW